MNGFGFIEYKDAMDARDVVPGELPRPSPSRECNANLSVSQPSVSAALILPSRTNERPNRWHYTDGSDFMGERLIVQFARGSRRTENFAHQERAAPRPRRTPFRMRISGLPVETSWQVSKSPHSPGCWTTTRSFRLDF
jgi:transcription initiation factor TFIID subunit 15